MHAKMCFTVLIERLLYAVFWLQLENVDTLQQKCDNQ